MSLSLLVGKTVGSFMVRNLVYSDAWDEQESIFPTIHQAITPQEEYVEYGYPHSYALVKHVLSYDVASGSEITPYIKIDKPLVVYRFSINILK